MDKDKKTEIETTEEVEKKKIDWKKVILWFIFAVVSLVGVFFLSTYIRWNAEIGDKYEVLYTGQEEVQIKELKDFLGFDIESDISDKQAIKAYCTSKFGSTCITADYTSKVENALRSPRYVVSIVILIDLILLYILLGDRLRKKFKTYIYAGVILLFGVYTIGYEIFQVADYYFFVNNNKNVVDAKIIYELVPNNGKEFRPVIRYEIDEKEYVTDIDVLKKEVGKEITVYYKNKKYDQIEVKRSMLGHIVPAIVGILIVIMGSKYLKLNLKEKKIKEEEEAK